MAAEPPRKAAFSKLHQDLDGAQVQAVYGCDDRLDIYEEEAPQPRARADAVAALFEKGHARRQGDGSVVLDVQPLRRALRLCPGEPFEDQPAGGFCTGFLVGPDLLATAGHCLEDVRPTSIRAVFGFQMVAEDEARTTLPADAAYDVVEVVGKSNEPGGSDWAVLRLDRPVTGREPLALAPDTKVARGLAVTVMGHPSGLPLKIASNAVVRESDPDQPTFTCNLDAFGGNSGSPVLDATTWKVIGILVSGERDFEKKGNCKVVKHCPYNGCLGEDVTRIAELLPALGRRR